MQPEPKPQRGHRSSDSDDDQDDQGEQEEGEEWEVEEMQTELRKPKRAKASLSFYTGSSAIHYLIYLKKLICYC